MEELGLSTAKENGQYVGHNHFQIPYIRQFRNVIRQWGEYYQLSVIMTSRVCNTERENPGEVRVSQNSRTGGGSIGRLRQLEFGGRVLEKREPYREELCRDAESP